MISWLVVFSIPSTVRSFPCRYGTPIYMYCPLRRTWSSVLTLFQPFIMYMYTYLCHYIAVDVLTYKHVSCNVITCMSLNVKEYRLSSLETIIELKFIITPKQTICTICTLYDCVEITFPRACESDHFKIIVQISYSS